MYKCEAVNPNVKGNNTILYSSDLTEWNHSWPDGEISYRLNDFTGDITSTYNQRRAVTVALRVWQLRINKLKFRQERNPDVSVDFNVNFEDVEHFSSANVFAHAYFPGQGDISGDVHINDSWNWVTHSELQSIGNPPLVPILIHEFGHSLGLTHDVENRGSIMWPSFNLGKRKNDLGPNDIERIQSRYGARSISQRFIDYFRYRRDEGLDFR